MAQWGSVGSQFTLVELVHCIAVSGNLTCLEVYCQQWRREQAGDRDKGSITGPSLVCPHMGEVGVPGGIERYNYLN